jgi:membrane-bound lytic murein transglycosylase B/archaellum component FlaC
MKVVTKNTVIFFVIAIFVFLSFGTQKAHAAFDCLTLTVNSNQSDRDYCQNELNQIEADLARLLDLQKQQQKQTGTLTGDVNYLTSQINALKAKIKARALVVAQLKVNITEKTKTINSLADKIENDRESLAQLIRKINKFDDENLVDVALSGKSLSDFYNDLESYISIGQDVKTLVDTVSGVKNQTEAAKQDLQKKQDAEIDAKAELESAQQAVAKSEADKKQLLAISKQTEAEYSKLATEKKIQADKIRNALFPLANSSQKIEFGTALSYANEAEKLTGVDPAFLLAILTQESNLGANVGQCYLTDQITGAGVGKNTGTPFPNVMKPMSLSSTSRKGDVDDFLRITNNLGLMWNQTAVSCPIAGAGGYGGAMGPAQFIPSTWSGYESRLKNTLGHDPNPWVARDAFFASAFMLADKGAVGNSTSAQNKAACRYYGSLGSSCTYSQSVQKLKASIQANIDLL